MSGVITTEFSLLLAWDMGRSNRKEILKGVVLKVKLQLGRKPQL